MKLIPVQQQGGFPGVGVTVSVPGGAVAVKKKGKKKDTAGGDE